MTLGRLRIRLRRREEGGAVAVLVAMLSVVLLMCAALSVDIGLQINKKQQLWASLDSAAQAGASKLPGSTSSATTAALAYAKAHDATETGADVPNVDFWCVVAATGSSAPYSVDTTQIPATCYPGAAPYTVGSTYGSTGRKITCSAVLCAIPCVTPATNTGTPKVACNTIRVYQGRDVPFGFSEAGGISKGNTGGLVSVACRGTCGTVAPNPLDVAVVADRTMSMSSSDVSDMITGIKGMLQQMTPSQQYVALGTIGRSAASSATQGTSCSSSQGSYPSSSVTTGAWIPTSFSNNYLSGTSLNTSSALVSQLNGSSCLAKQSPQSTGTALAAPMKAAARYLLGIDTNNLAALPARSTTAQKILIFETDGEPNERIASGAKTGSTDLYDSSDPFVSGMHLSGSPTTQVGSDTKDVSNGVTTVTHHKTVTYYYDGGSLACQNLLAVAANAKAAGIRVITIAYNMDGLHCGDYDGRGTGNDYSDYTNYTSDDSTVNGPESNTSTKKYKTETVTKWVKNSTGDAVLNVLAAASGTTTTSSTADSDCSTSAERSAENSDGDDFFCAASGSDMSSIFTTALSQASSGIKLMNLPGS